ncbi:hypothetical protein M670_02699 [Schinkia azotoformans MEV2011]|uniref:Uncharacterized protein n=1 Tax=Schinkia azotoformans MEV2011 TaxID=1348973 RepID=A0A072NLY8_SCHAZ|nr:hypothetical protein M670_02699 [Schinkia azotoformans MEV2011]
MYAQLDLGQMQLEDKLFIQTLMKNSNLRTLEVQLTEEEINKIDRLFR